MLASDVVDRVYAEWLYPAGIDRPLFDKLAGGGIDNDDLTITLSGRVANVPRDTLLEIESELILIDSVAGSVVTVLERGYLNTDPVGHAAGVKVLVDPKFTRKAVFGGLVSTVKTLYPKGVIDQKLDQTVTFSTQGLKQLPAGGRRIISILVDKGLAYTDYGPKLRPGTDYRTFNEFDPPKYRLIRGGAEGRAMVVSYAADFESPPNEQIDLSSLGIPDAIQEHMPLGVAGWILQGREIPRVVVEEVRRMLATQGVQVGAALNVGQALLRQFDAKIAEQVQRQRDEVGAQWEYVGR